MKRLKSIGIFLIVLGVTIILIMTFIKNLNWVNRFDTELDRFFGEGNWEYIDKETKRSAAIKERFYSRNTSIRNRQSHGTYTNWYISFTNKYGEKEEWYISNYLYKINKTKNDVFSTKRLTRKQAFYIELMDIALYSASKDIFNEFFKDELTESEAASIDIAIYESGKLNPEFINSLMKEQWFTIHNVTADDFLFNDLQEFYIHIRGPDYKVEKLTEQERKNVLEALNRIESRLVEKYGDHASFEIIFDGEQIVEYRNGQKQ